MNKKIATCLKNLIEAERLYFRRVLADETGYVSPDCRIVDLLGCTEGHERRSWKAAIKHLEDAGLIEWAYYRSGENGGYRLKFVSDKTHDPEDTFQDDRPDTPQQYD